MLSVPAILTGNYPKAFATQSFLNYPVTLFTLLADSHRMNVYESTTTLCSPKLCTNSAKLSKTPASRIKLLLADVGAIYLHIISPPSLNKRLPVINMTWEDYWGLGEAVGWQRHNYAGRMEQLRFFIDSISSGDRPGLKPGLNVVHTNFPHLPYQYLPSGKRYQGEWEIPGLDFASDQWGDNQWMITQAYQRFMLQAAAADLVIEDLVARMKTIGIYDESMIIIVADHGVSFYPNSKRRDAPPFGSFERDVLPVPLFIKYPFQTQGEVSDENVETIDILPTIVDVLGVAGDLNMDALNMDGRSLLGQQPPRPEKIAFHAYREFLKYQGDASGEAKYDTLKWKLENFQPASGIDGLFDIGQYRQLIGSQLNDLDINESVEISTTLDMPGLYLDVDPASGFVPSRISGTIRSNDPPVDNGLVVAVNGVVRAVTEIYPAGENTYKFSAMVPEHAFEKGENSVAALLVVPGSNGVLKFLMSAKRSGQQSARGTPAWTLTDDRIIGPNREIPILADKLKGALEYVSVDDGTIEFFGWAMDVGKRELVDEIMIFENGQYVYSGVTGMPRGEGELYDAPSVILVGFQFIIPANLFQSPGNSDIRVFAISKHGYATELEYFDGYEWNP